MATLTEYFQTEARDFLVQLERELSKGPLPDASALQRAARGLRGTAQMAREDHVFRAASAFETVLRALASNILSWSDDTVAKARETVSDLRALVDREEDEAQLDARAETVVERWSHAGVAMPAHLHGSAPPPSDASDTREFREYAAREVIGIAEALDTGVQQLAAAPMDREPLKMILRRQRALLGAARLEEIPVVAEVLRAIEDLTRVIAKLDVGVKQEWLDIYRVAREALKATIEPLQRDEDPQHTHAVSRLRHMREELMERYGAGDPASASHPEGGFAASPSAQANASAVSTAAAAAAPPPAASAPAPSQDDAAAELVLDTADIVEEGAVDDDAPNLLAAAANAMQRAVGAATTAVAAGITAAASTVQAVAETVAGADAGDDAGAVIPIEDLVYSGDAALARALELRETIARVAADDPAARDAVEELFDLIRLARS